MNMNVIFSEYQQYIIFYSSLLLLVFLFILYINVFRKKKSLNKFVNQVKSRANVKTLKLVIYPHRVSIQNSKENREQIVDAAKKAYNYRKSYLLRGSLLVVLFFIFWVVILGHELVYDEQFAVVFILLLDREVELYKRYWYIKHLIQEKVQKKIEKRFKAIVIFTMICSLFFVIYHPITKWIFIPEVKNEQVFLENDIVICAHEYIGRYKTLTTGKKFCRLKETNISFLYNGTRLESNEENTLTRIRLQNYYSSDPSYVLTKNDFYIELSIYNHEKNQKMTPSCEEFFTDETGNVSADSVLRDDKYVLEGTLGYVSSENNKRAMCYNGETFDLVAIVTEAKNTQRPVTDVFFESLVFDY